MSNLDMISPTECPMCKSTNLVHNQPYTNTYWPDLNYFDELSISYCSSCGFGFSWPEIPNQIVETFYDAEYRRESSPFYIDFSQMTNPFGLNYRSLSQILLAKQYVNFKAGDCFLDIGPGGGHSFSTASEGLPDPNCVAIELNSGAAEAFQRHYGVKTFRSLREFIDSRYRAKICLLSHSLEHYKLSWLSDAFEEFKRLLAPDGVMVVEVPLVDMRIHADLRFEDSPHFLFFSIDSIKLAFEKSGWNVLFVNSAAEYYEEWLPVKINVIAHGHPPPLPLKSKIRLRLKMACSRLPLFLQRQIYSAALWSKSSDINFKHPQFCYGGDRTCLRIVAQPTKVS